MKSIILLLCLSIFTDAEVLRLSIVVEKPGPDITRYEFGKDGQKQVIFVNDQPIVTEAEIASAMPSHSQKDAIDVTLNKEGADKMTAATGEMRAGIARIAIIIDGEVISAPVVQSVPLGKNFVISGLNNHENHEPEKLAARLSGKSEEELMREFEQRDKAEKFYKEANEGESNLLFQTPEIDPSEPVNYIALLENTKLEAKDKTIEFTDSDYKKAIANLYSAASTAEKGTIRTDCDLLRFISPVIPEIATLAKRSKSGKIPVSSIQETLKPYILGEKEIP